MEKGKLKGILEEYDSQYSMDAFLVFAATNSSEVNERVYIDAAARGQLINRTDCPEQSNFIVPAVVRRGMLSIAVSTSGASPSLAVEISQKLEQEYDKLFLLQLATIGYLSSMQCLKYFSDQLLVSFSLYMDILILPVFVNIFLSQSDHNRSEPLSSLGVTVLG
jgi:hypothetical protein